MKVHAGVDKDSGLIHSVVVTVANVHGLSPAPEFLHRNEDDIYGDAGCKCIAKRAEIEAKTTEFRVAMRPGKRRVLPETGVGRLRYLIEIAKVHIRCKVERLFRAITWKFGFYQARLHGLPKNHCKTTAQAALTNLLMASRKLFAFARLWYQCIQAGDQRAAQRGSSGAIA